MLYSQRIFLNLRPYWIKGLYVWMDALESGICDVIKIRLKRRDATRRGKGNQPLNIKTAVERPILRLGSPNFRWSFNLIWLLFASLIFRRIIMTSHRPLSNASCLCVPVCVCMCKKIYVCVCTCACLKLPQMKPLIFYPGTRRIPKGIRFNILISALFYPDSWT